MSICSLLPCPLPYRPGGTDAHGHTHAHSLTLTKGKRHLLLRKEKELTSCFTDSKKREAENWEGPTGKTDFHYKEQGELSRTEFQTEKNCITQMRHQESLSSRDFHEEVGCQK